VFFGSAFLAEQTWKEGAMSRTDERNLRELGWLDEGEEEDEDEDEAVEMDVEVGDGRVMVDSG
jgi:hypothetical protein